MLKPTVYAVGFCLFFFFGITEYFGSGAKVGDYAKRFDNRNKKKSIFLTPLN
jgi:hypothetical protein